MAKTVKKKPATKKKAPPKTEKVKAVAKVAAAEIVPEVDAKSRDVAQRQHERIKALGSHISRKWSELGVELRDFRDNRRWQPLGFASLDAWIADVADELGMKRSTFYDVVTTSRKLAELPAADIREMPRENAKDLARLPESKRRPLIQAAKEKPNREFRQLVNSQLEGAAREKNIVMSFSVPESQAVQIEETLKVSGWLAETEVRAEQLEFICAEFLSARCEHEDAKGGESNQDFYHRLHPSKE